MSSLDFDNVRLTSLGGVPHRVTGGIRMSGSAEELQAELDVMFRQEDFETVLDALFPQPIITANLVTIQPRSYLLGAPYLRAHSFRTANDVEPGKPVALFGNDPTAPEGTYGQLISMTITYKTMQESEDEEPDEGSPETFLEHSVNAGAEYLQIPPKKIDVSEKDVDEYTPGGPDVNSPGAPADAEANKDAELGIYKVIPTVEHSLKWKFALNPHWTNIYRRIGTLNQSELRFFNDAKKETVLFTGISGSRSYRYFRRRTNITPWSLDFKFSQRVIFEGSKVYGWNHVYSPSKQKWIRPIRVNDNNKSLYETSDFTKLFQTSG
jgi:hypothetical protein